jgi:hypothetical protein
MTDRKDFKMTQADYDGLLERIGKPAPLIMLQCGGPSSRQAIANAAWCELGDRMGFDGMTVEPSSRSRPLDFTAIPKPIAPAAEPGIEAGHVCNRDGCTGTIAERDTDTCCSCHINPPCGHCTTSREFCPVCEWDAEEEQRASN